MMVKISAIIITLNEEKNIGRCIESLVNIVDEIVVVDAFSSDATKSICQKLQVRFLQHPFVTYAQQKNYAMAQAGYDHVLSLDADEVPDQVLQGEIIRTKANWQGDGYSCNRLTRHGEKWVRHSGWYPDRQLRLLDRRRGQWTGGRVHERITMAAGAKTLHLVGNLLHYSYASLFEHIGQTNKYTTLAAEDAWERKEKASLVEMTIRPGWQFFRDYILKGGMLDGKKGFVICTVNAFKVFLKYAKIQERSHSFDGANNAPEVTQHSTTS